MVKYGEDHRRKTEDPQKTGDLLKMQEGCRMEDPKGKGHPEKDRRVKDHPEKDRRAKDRPVK